MWAFHLSHAHIRMAPRRAEGFRLARSALISFCGDGRLGARDVHTGVQRLQGFLMLELLNEEKNVTAAVTVSLARLAVVSEDRLRPSAERRER